MVVVVREEEQSDVEEELVEYASAVEGTMEEVGELELALEDMATDVEEGTGGDSADEVDAIWKGTYIVLAMSQPLRIHYSRRFLCKLKCRSTITVATTKVPRSR